MIVAWHIIVGMKEMTLIVVEIERLLKIKSLFRGLWIALRQFAPKLVLFEFVGRVGLCDWKVYSRWRRIANLSMLCKFMLNINNKKHKINKMK